jgi:hypothetical protein
MGRVVGAFSLTAAAGRGACPLAKWRGIGGRDERLLVHGFAGKQTLGPPGGSTGSSGSTGSTGDRGRGRGRGREILYRELVLALAAAADGTGAEGRTEKPQLGARRLTVGRQVPGGIVRYSCAASVHRGDRGLQSASEANGMPPPNQKSEITNCQCLCASVRENRQQATKATKLPTKLATKWRLSPVPTACGGGGVTGLRHPIPIRDICACEAGNP